MLRRPGTNHILHLLLSVIAVGSGYRYGLRRGISASAVSPDSFPDSFGNEVRFAMLDEFRSRGTITEAERSNPSGSQKHYVSTPSHLPDVVLQRARLMLNAELRDRTHRVCHH